MRPQNKEVMRENGCPRPFPFTSPSLGARFAIQIRSIWNAHLATLPRLDNIKFATSLVVLFLLTHPYGGIRHDAILYTAQALHNASPQHFAHDLFFQYGSQDDWTVYGTLYSKLVAAFGIRTSNLLGLIVAQALWWSGMWRLTKRLLPAPWNWFCLFFAASMPADYGAGAVFSYGEIFLSARLPAEALSLWAIAFMLERRHGPAIAFAGFATVIHPLIGNIAFAVVLLNITPRVKWWRVFVVALVLFAVAQYLPFSFLHIHPFDAEWRAVARFNVSFLFPSLWNRLAWSKACWAIAVPAVLAASEPKGHRKFWVHLTLIGVAGVGICTLADFIGRDALWIQLQSWRVLWLLTLLQWPALAILLYRERQSRPALIWVLAICWLILDVGGGIVALALAVALHAESLLKPPGSPAQLLTAITSRGRIVLAATTLATAVPWIIFQAAYHRLHELYLPSPPPVDWPWLEALAHTRLIGVVAAELIVLNLLQRGKYVAILYILLIALLSYAFVDIDQRSDPAKILEVRADDARQAPFSGRVPPGAMVYWDGPSDEAVFPWLLMKTSSYFSSAQAAGMIFHRETTFEALRRFSLIKQDAAAGRPQGTEKENEDGDSLIFSNPRLFKPLRRDGLVHVWLF